MISVSTRVRFAPLFRSLAVSAMVVLAAAVRADQVSFSQILTPAERTATGFDRLTSEQAKALNALIERDVSAARQGDVVAFAKTFTQRRSPEEWKRAGIDRLTETERAQLDRLVATAVAARPVVPFVRSPYTPGGADSVSIDKPKPEVHGDVSVFVGAGSGGYSAYGGAFDATVTDPSHRFTFGVGMSDVHVRGGRSCIDGPIW